MRVVRQFALIALSLLVTEQAFGQGQPLRGEDLLEEARPHLEAILGVRLQRLPTTRAVSSAEFAALADAVLDRELPWRLGDLDAKTLARTKAVALGSLRGGMVAGQNEGEETILFAPANALAIAGWDKSLSGTRLRSFLRLALVHEVTRRVLEQRYDLSGRRAACREPEELFALQALLEGRAQYVTRAVARKLGDEETFAVLAEAFRFVPDTASDGTARLVSRQVTARRRWAYLQGLAFFDALEAAGITDAETRAFARPPKLTAWIEHPDLFLRAEKLGLSDLSDALTRLSSAMPAKQWDAVQQPWTAAMIEQAATLLGESARAERAIKGWEAGRSLAWSNRSAPLIRITVGVVRFSDDASAASYFGLAIDLLRKQDELFTNSKIPEWRNLLGTKTAALSLTGFDEAMRVERKMQLGEGGGSLAVTQILARTGNRVIELTWHGVPPEDDWGRRIFELLRQEK